MPIWSNMRKRACTPSCAICGRKSDWFRSANWPIISPIRNFIPGIWKRRVSGSKRKKRIGKFSAPFGLTKMSRVEVEEPAYLCDEDE